MSSIPFCPHSHIGSALRGQENPVDALLFDEKHMCPPCFCTNELWITNEHLLILIFYFSFRLFCSKYNNTRRLNNWIWSLHLLCFPSNCSSTIPGQSDPAVYHRIVNERKRSDTPFSGRLRQLLIVHDTRKNGRNTITAKWSIYSP
jgi:hypothetical protein